MELTAVRSTVKGPAATFTGDVYVTPIQAGAADSRLIEPVTDEDHAAADNGRYA